MKKNSVSQFVSFMERISIVKTCTMRTKEEAVITLQNGSCVGITVLLAETGYPKQVSELIANNRKVPYGVIFAPYISEQTAKMCKEAGFGYLDLAGNCHIAYESLFIEIKGYRNENVPKRALKSVYERSSVVSSYILRILLEDVNRVWRMKELADEAECSIGQVAKVKDFLLNQGYIEQSAKGIRVCKPDAMLKDWAAVYAKGEEETISCYSADSIPKVEQNMAEMKESIGISCVLTGFSGGARYQPVVRYQKVHAYIKSEDKKKVLEHLGLKEVDTGSNVVLIVRYDDCVEYNVKERKGNRIVSPVQAYLDLMSMKGRGEEMAEAILEREICK